MDDFGVVCALSVSDLITNSHVLSPPFSGSGVLSVMWELVFLMAGFCSERYTVEIRLIMITQK